MRDDICTRRRLVIAHIIYGTCLRLGDGDGQHLRDVGHVDAREDLARLIDPPGLAAPHGGERIPSGSVNPCQAEDVHCEAVLLAEGKPALLYRKPASAAHAGRGRRRALVDPGAAGVAVDPRGREIADPFHARQGGDIGTVAVQRRIALPIGWN